MIYHMIPYKLVTLWILFSCIVLMNSIEPISIAIGGLAVGAGSYLWNRFDSDEKCSDSFINCNWSALQRDLRGNVTGQDIAINYAFYSIKSHYTSRGSNSKALTLGFYGLPGTGKNLVSDIIARHYYKNGLNSKFVHKFNSRIDFPDDEKIDVYQEQLRSWIIRNITLCARSLFIFDEVDKFPAKVLDVLTPFIDHHSNYGKLSFSEAIFIFLSNVGGEAIRKRFMDLESSGYFLNGKSRSDMTVNDFEDVIKMWAYNDDGALKHSNLIDANLIDHYIPFLPLEKEHVVKCIQNDFEALKGERKRRYQEIDDKELQEYVLNALTFEPEPSNKFSSSGCKRVKAKVKVYIEKMSYVF